MSEGVLVVAARWIAALATGSLATAVAILAVAAVGLAMLAGRVRWRRGVEVVLGVFVIFGASSLANGVLVPKSPDTVEAQAPITGPAVSVRPPPPAVYDPYAGASVPMTRAPSDLIAPHP